MAKTSTRKTSKKLSSYDVAAQIQKEITDKVIEALEAGTRPWSRGWAATGGLALRSNGEAYQGVNQFLLGLYASVHGFTSQFWLTFKQAQADGLKIIKGSKATKVVFSKPLLVKDDREPEGVRKVFMLKSYNVFNLDQLEGEIPAKYQPAAIEARKLDPAQRLLDAEGALWASGAAVVAEGGNQAFYSPKTDTITLPRFEDFKTASGFCATLAHELCHWTGHKDRLARDGIVKFDRFGSAQYAREELIAELGAAMIGAELGFAGDNIDSHASYLASWLKALKSDPKAIFKAAGDASKAANWVLANHRAAVQAETEGFAEEMREAA